MEVVGKVGGVGGHLLSGDELRPLHTARFISPSMLMAEEMFPYPVLTFV